MTIEDVNKVVDLKSLKEYINKFGYSEQICKKFRLSEPYIMMLVKVIDINEIDGESIPISNNTVKIFKKNPDITQHELQCRFDIKKAEMLYAHIFHIKRHFDYNNFKDGEIQRYYEYLCGVNHRQKALRKNEKLVKQYNKAIENYCGIGTKRTKKLLEMMSKNGDANAELYLIAFKAEEKNILAKHTSVYNVRETLYKEKAGFIMSLVKLCHKRSDIIYGCQESDNYSANGVIYFELPGMEQISYHMNMTPDIRKSIPKYEKEWDGKINSTLPKIEKVIRELYKDEIIKIIENIPKELEQKKENKRRHKAEIRRRRLEREKLREQKMQEKQNMEII